MFLVPYLVPPFLHLSSKRPWPRTDTTLIKLLIHLSIELCPPTTNPQEGQLGCRMSETASAWSKMAALVSGDVEITPNLIKVVDRTLVETEFVDTSLLENVYGQIADLGSTCHPYYV